MSNHFLDTSSLVKHYHAEIGTPKVDRLWMDAGARLFISRLSVVETVSVFAKKVRTGVISGGDFDLLRRRFFADLRKRKPFIVRMLVKHFQAADALLQRHGPVRSLYTLDALQLAVALDLRDRGLLDEVVAADQVFEATRKKRRNSVRQSLKRERRILPNLFAYASGSDEA